MSSANSIVIVKLGGAAITIKKGVCELAPKDQLDKIFDQVSLSYQVLKQAGHQIILVHGAGCFGHPQAKKYNLKAGWNSGTIDTPDVNYIKGYSHIRSCLQQLSHVMISGLESRNVPVLAMSPIDYITTNNCEETSTEEFIPIADRVRKYLELGFVPVLHGDAVLDHIRGCTILSGDIIMYQLSRLLQSVVRCVFITDVEGVYQTDPKLLINSAGSNELICKVVINHDEEDLNHTHKQYTQEQEQIDSKLADVTGSMQGKIRWAKKIVSKANTLSMDTIICKWGSKEAYNMMTLQSSEKATNHYKMTVFTLKN